MMERAGKKNGNNKDWQFWQQHNKPIEVKCQDLAPPVGKLVLGTSQKKACGLWGKTGKDLLE